MLTNETTDAEFQRPSAAFENSPDLLGSAYARGLENAVGKLVGQPGNCGRNAFQHLRLAWTLRDIDPGMAAFRAITAEEEAAAAIILAVQRKGYPNSMRLDAIRHPHKVSIFALFQVLSRIFATTDCTPSIYLFDKDDPPRVRIEIDMNTLAGIPEDGPMLAEPMPPLGFAIQDLRGAKNFATEFEVFASENGFARAYEFIKAEAALRNRILYATENGLPGVEHNDAFLVDRKDRVLALLTVLIMIEQTDEHQLFVSQCLAALTQLLPNLDRGDVLYPSMPPSQATQVRVERTQSTSKVEIVKDGRSGVAAFKYAGAHTFRARWLKPWIVRVPHGDQQ